MAYFRFRIITNFNCNQNCYFCFQPLKEKIILPIDKLLKTINKCKYMKRSTIMGGESLLVPNLPEYIKIAKTKSQIVCLVTNGTLLNEDNLLEFKKCGLDEIAISISSLEQYNNRFEQIKLANDIIPNCRVNIPKCWESVGNKLYYLIDKILNDDIGVVVCEDLMGRYGIFEFEKYMGAELIRTDGYNFLTYKYKDKEFGLFAHYEGYNRTDIIITPIGNFSDWRMYCKKIGNHELS